MRLLDIWRISLSIELWFCTRNPLESTCKTAYNARLILLRKLSDGAKNLTLWQRDPTMLKPPFNPT